MQKRQTLRTLKPRLARHMDCTGLSHGVSFGRILAAVRSSGDDGVLRIEGAEGTGRILVRDGEICAVYIEGAHLRDKSRQATAYLWRGRHENHEALDQLRNWGLIEYRFLPEKRDEDRCAASSGESVYNAIAANPS